MKLFLLSIGICLVLSSVAQLNTEIKPGQNFDLSDWKLNYPMNNATQENLTTFTNDYFYTDPTTGGMVFKCPNIVNATGGSTYPRCELRELLNKNASASDKTNNWTLSTNTAKEEYGGYNGILSATLSVDHVSTTYDEEFRVGRVIVGQIHGDDNEPCRIYYRLLPGNTKGSVYFAHEQSKAWGDDKQEFWHELIGSRSSSASEPENGIALGEIWSYKIDVQGESMTVSIYNSEGIEIASKTISSAMTGDDNFDATYASSDNYLYFKAGVYNQNNGGDAADYAQATFYELSNTHPTDLTSTPMVAASPSSLTFPSVAGSTNVNITSNANWTCSTTDSWITLSVNNGSGNGSLSVSVVENTTTEVRSGSITLKAEDGNTSTVLVSQAIVIPPGQAQELIIASATASIENTAKGEIAENVLDDDVSTIWAGDGSNADPTLDLELSTYSMVSAIEIGFSKQTLRETYFSVQYWDDTQYVDILTNQTQVIVAESEATSLYTFNFPEAVPSNKIRVVGHGNSDSEWNSYTEVNLYGWDYVKDAVNDYGLNKISLFPNPCKGSFVIENCSGLYIQVLDLSGVILFVKQISTNSEKVEMNLTQGVYIVNVIGGQQITYSSKLFVN